MPKRPTDYCSNTHPNVTTGVLEDLPKSQKISTGGRHRCAACAYEAGLAEGLRRARKALAKIAKDSMPTDPVTGKKKPPESDLAL